MFGIIGATIVYTVFLWWFSTGAILWLNRLPSVTYRLSLIAASLVAVAATWGLVASMTDPSPAGAVLAFTATIGLWGWHEISFLTGFVAGPQTRFCPPDARGWSRFRLAAATVIYHEIALVLTAGVIAAITWGQPNQIGLWAFAILLVSRLSAKFNLFLGVPNFTDEFFPDRLRYLSSYIRKGPVNALLPVSAVAGTLLAVLEARAALASTATAFHVVGYTLLCALTSLALIEHLFMVLPLQDAALWRWAMPAAPKGNNAS